MKAYSKIAVGDFVRVTPKEGDNFAEFIGRVEATGRGALVVRDGWIQRAVFESQCVEVEGRDKPEFKRRGPY